MERRRVSGRRRRNGNTMRDGSSVRPFLEFQQTLRRGRRNGMRSARVPRKRVRALYRRPIHGHEQIRRRRCDRHLHGLNNGGWIGGSVV